MEDRGWKLKKILLVILLAVYLFRLWQSTGCKDFSSFRFQKVSIIANVEGQVQQDSNRTTAKFFHNKITTGAIEISKSYAKIFEPRVLLEILGPFGITLVIIALYDLFKKKNKIVLLHLAAMLFASILSIFILSPKLSFWVIALIMQSFSFWGIRKISKSNVLVFLILTVGTICYFAFSWQYQTLCNEIFFN